MAQIRGTAGYNLGSQDRFGSGPARSDATNDPSPLEQIREQTSKIEEWLDTAADPIKPTLIIIRKYPEYAVFGLIGVVVTQALGYGLIFDLNFFLRNLSVMGGLLMVLSDSWVRKKFAPAGLPLPNEKDRKNLCDGCGRIQGEMERDDPGHHPEYIQSVGEQFLDGEATLPWVLGWIKANTNIAARAPPPEGFCKVRFLPDPVNCVSETSLLSSQMFTDQRLSGGLLLLVNMGELATTDVLEVLNLLRGWLYLGRREEEGLLKPFIDKDRSSCPIGQKFVESTICPDQHASHVKAQDTCERSIGGVEVCEKNGQRHLGSEINHVA
ncbi:uncharacterized protein KY384_002252 [Bacidia gigantensis]|uniref:uncharacterized protein n=1 Tax=Bacidia gigantensis TaxID=2732470 RepID=UPI001D057B20|nr:uncharacterized protein KY384_002252 [Bacidia gigantensis]KAG8533469.1 hypothetical protein KY384_002252 [Bacidia gigantensis]